MGRSPKDPVGAPDVRCLARALPPPHPVGLKARAVLLQPQGDSPTPVISIENSSLFRENAPAKLAVATRIVDLARTGCQTEAVPGAAHLRRQSRVASWARNCTALVDVQ